MQHTYEIECKAWVDDPEAIREKLHQKYSYREKYTKDDTYYRFPGQDRVFRIRRQKNSAIITMKEKSRQNGMEENLEIEFSVSDFHQFFQFISQFNCPLYVQKRKTSEVFVEHDITIELSYVETLGWFIEVEKLVRSEHDKEKEDAKASIRTILRDLEISEEKVESRYYTELLTGTEER